MDIFQILELYGIPVVVTIVFGYFIWKQNLFIQKELLEKIETNFRRMEGIVIKLIDQQKKTQLELKGVKGYVEGIESIMKKLTGNGLKKNG